MKDFSLSRAYRIDQRNQVRSLQTPVELPLINIESKGLDTELFKRSIIQAILCFYQYLRIQVKFNFIFTKYKIKIIRMKTKVLQLFFVFCRHKKKKNFYFTLQKQKKKIRKKEI